jgi:peptide deformylase
LQILLILQTAFFVGPAVDKLEWQVPLQVIKYPDPRLRAPNARIGVFDDSLRELARQMFEVMYQ